MIQNKLKRIVALDPQVIATDTATNGTAIDTVDNLYTGVSIVFGTYTDGTYAIKFQEDDNSSFTSATDLAAADVLGDSYNSAVTPSDGESYNYQLLNTERYVRAVITSASTTTGTSIAGLAVLSSNRASIATEQNPA